MLQPQTESSDSPRSMLQQHKVLFSTTHQVQFGEIVKVVGQGPQLGKWDVSQAPGTPPLPHKFFLARFIHPSSLHVTASMNSGAAVYALATHQLLQADSTNLDASQASCDCVKLSQACSMLMACELLTCTNVHLRSVCDSACRGSPPRCYKSV